MSTRFKVPSRFVWLTSVVLLSLFCFSSERTQATYTNNPPAQPGFTHTPFSGTDDRGYGLKLSGGIISDSSPLLCDLLGNSQKDIVVAGTDGIIYAYRPNGTLLWSYNTGAPIYSSPACGDLNGDGRIAVVVGLGNKYYPSSQPEIGNGGVIALDGAIGTLRWRFYTMDDEFGTRSGLTDVVYSSPSLGDLNGDGKLEVVFGGWDRRIYALDSNGKMLWQYFQLDTVWSSPAIADLDNSGHPAVIIGGDSTADAYLGTPAGGYLYAFNGDGTIRWRALQDQTIYSSPTVGDITGDGYLDVVVGTGNYYSGKGYHVYAYDRNGNLLPGWPTNTSGYVRSAPALVDLNSDGIPDVVALSDDSYLYAWNGSGSLLWSMYADGTFHGSPVTFYSPIAADVGGCNFSGASNPARGSPSLLFGKDSDVIVVNSSGIQLTDHPNNTTQCTVSIWSDASINLNSVAVGDIDNDGVLEIVVASGDRYDPTHGYLYAWKVSNASGAKLPWPQFRQNPQHTAVYPKAAFSAFDDAVVVSNTIPSVLPLNFSATATVSFRNTGSTTWMPSTVKLVPVTGDPLGNGSSYSLTSSIAPGGIATFTIQLSSPNSNTYAATNWRMSRIGGSNFGLAATRKVKIGNQPGYYVLRGDGRVFNGGLATSISPVDTWSFDAARQLALSYNGAGGYVFDLYGPYHYAPSPGMSYGPNANLPIIPPGYTSMGTESLREVNLVGSTFWGMDVNGNFTAAGGQALIAGLPAAPGGGQAISFALTPNRDGVYMLLRDCSIRRSTAASVIPNTPTFSGQDRCRKIKTTADGTGYYILDKFGQVYNGGSAPAISTPSGFPASTEVAADFELTADGKGYYLLTLDGAVYTAGTAAPIVTNPTPTWTVNVNTGQVAHDLALVDSQISSMPVLQAAPTSLSLGYSFGSGNNPTFSITIANVGGPGSIDWTATPPSGVTLNTTSGTVSTSATINGSLSANGYQLGTYSIGSILFTGTLSGRQPAVGSPQSVPLTLRVYVPSYTYLPLVRR